MLAGTIEAGVKGVGSMRVKVTTLLAIPDEIWLEWLTATPSVPVKMTAIWVLSPQASVTVDGTNTGPETGAAGGAPVPRVLDTVNVVVSPAASVTANGVLPPAAEHTAPVTVTLTPPPLVATVVGLIWANRGDVFKTVYGGVPPKI